MGFGSAARCDKKYINPGLFYEIGRLEKFGALRVREGEGLPLKHALLAAQFLWAMHNGLL